MKAGRFLAVVVAFMMIFAVMPVSLEAGTDPQEIVWVGPWENEAAFNTWRDSLAWDALDWEEGDIVWDINALLSIQAALNRVQENGTIYILPGTYEEDDATAYSLRITKNGITLQGINPDGTPITDYESEDIPKIVGQKEAAGISYLINADNVTLSGLRILPKPATTDWAAHVFWITGSNFTLENCLIDFVEGSNGNLNALYFQGEGAISAHIEGNRLEGMIQFTEGAGGPEQDSADPDIWHYTKIIGNEVYPAGTRSSLEFHGEGSAQSIVVEENMLMGRIVFWSGAGAGSRFSGNEIHATGETHFIFYHRPGGPDSPGLESVSIRDNKFLGHTNGRFIESYDANDNHPAARWMFDLFGNNDVGEAYAIVKDMDTFELREISAASSYVYGYSDFPSALEHAQAGDTIFSFLPVTDGTMTLNFNPDDMPEDSSLVMIELHGPPILISMPVAGFGADGTHTASAQLADDDGGLAIPEGYDFLLRMVLTIEGPGVTDGEFVEGNPAQIWVVSLPEGIDADDVLLLRYNEVTEEWEEQDKEIDEHGTLIFTTPQWSDFVFVMETAEEPPEETPETGTAVMWLIPFGLLLLAGGLLMRRRAVA